MKKIFLTILLLISLSSIKTNTANAQSCSGSVVSSGLYDCVFNPLAGKEQCTTSGTSTSLCTYQSFWGQCRGQKYIAESCIDTGGSCVKQNKYDGEVNTGCTTILPPPPPPPLGPPPPPPPASWGACGSCTASGCQTQYSRTDGSGGCVCDPSGCGYVPPPGLNPRCVVQNNLAPTVWTVGQTGKMNANISYYDGGTFSSVSFTSTDQTVLQLVAGSNILNSNQLIRKNVATLAPGTSTYRVRVTLTNGATCQRATTVTVNAASSWWQVYNSGDVISAGDITSQIPDTCTAAEAGGTCRDELVVEDTSSLIPGLVVYGSGTPVYKATASSGGNANIGGAAGPSWTSLTSYNGTQYSYDYFSSLASAKTFKSISGNINQGDINSTTADADGFVWIKAVGDLHVQSAINISSKKAIIFIQDGDLYIDKEVRVNNSETDFVMFIVGNSGGTGGNIYVDPSVGNNSATDTTPNLTGVFWADGIFDSGTSGLNLDKKLVIYGSVAAQGGFNLQRSINSTDVNTNPAEAFYFAPEFQMNFPQTLSSKRLIWREVAP